MLKQVSKSNLKALRKGKGRTKVIALAGTSYGVGVTHTAILLANCLRRHRLNVAIVEMNGSRHFESIEKAYEGMGFDPTSTEAFQIKGVTYYKAFRQNQLHELYQRPYDLVILDLGNDLHTFSEVFRMADYQVLVGRLTDWKEQEISEFAIRFSQVMGERTRWFIPFALAKEVKLFKKQYGYKAYPLDFSRDPFANNSVISQQLIQLFS